MVIDMNYIDKNAKAILKEDLLQLDKRQLKLFYGVLVHYWLKNRFFLSEQNALNWWCELNQRCSEADESFPSPYDDHELLKSFCQAHPFYFIEILSPELIVNLFCQYFDDRIDILAAIVNKLRTEGLKAAYVYSNKALGLAEDVEKLVAETERYVKYLT